MYRNGLERVFNVAMCVDDSFFLIIKDIVNRWNAGTCWAVNVYY